MPSAPSLHIVLHQPEIPQNTGNISRTCLAVGARLWLIRPLGFRLDDHYLRRAGLDYWEHVDVQVVDDWQEFCRTCPAPRHWYFTRRATKCYWDVNYQLGDALIFGSETVGLPDSILNLAPESNVRIPIDPQVRSLNLSNAVAVATFEALRQSQSLDGPPS